MTFTSLSYFLFLPACYLLFYWTPQRMRWAVLLLSSLAFYAMLKTPYLLVVLVVVTVISYCLARRMAACPEEKGKRLLLSAGICSNVVILASLNHLPLATRAINSLFATGITVEEELVLVGVSYFTFQGMSYLLDVYLEVQEPERHFGIFALYMAFFPKLLQGPIERAEDLLPQLKKPYRFDYAAVRSGLYLFTLGLVKKVVVADRLALYPDMIYGDVHAHTGLTLLLATYAYALQIYFDFSGYTDMARGTARIFGIELTENFNHPYLATSVTDFWRRWHISFSRWILDYIFRPLQMGWRGLGQGGTTLALIATFLVSGIWHGATWGFVVWGMLHGVYLAAGAWYRPHQKKVHRLLGVEKKGWLSWWQIFATFNLVSFAWIFFRAQTLSDACYVVTHLLPLRAAAVKETFLMHNEGNLLVAALFTALFAAAAFVPSVEARLKGCLVGRRRWAVYYAVVMLVLVCGKFGGGEFIYDRF